MFGRRKETTEPRAWVVRGGEVKKLTEAVRLCADADAALKLSGSGYTEIERLVCAL